MESILDNNLLLDCPVTRKDMSRAEEIFGPDLVSLKGKTVRRTPGHVNVENTDILPYIVENNGDITLAIDIMFINRLPFMITISRNVKFCICELLTNMRTSTILDAVLHVIALYQSRGFRVTHL
jgi:hypothetical protein